MGKNFETMEEDQHINKQLTNGFHHYKHPSSSSSSSLTSQNLQLNHHHNQTHDHHLSIFPPINHEGLPIPPISLPNSNSNSSSEPHSSSSPPTPPKPHLIQWFDFALHIWNSKLLSLISFFRSCGVLPLLLRVASTASFLGFLWFWVRRRRRRLRNHGGIESVQQLKLLIKEKDEKIIQLLEQIALMNKVLLARYRVPVSNAS